MKFSPQLKLALHNELIQYINGEKIYPINIEISLCGICNANCSWCFYKTEHTKKILKTKTILNFLKEAEQLKIKAITWTGGGEPTLHPDFKNIVNETILDQGLITNALKIPDYNPTKFSWIRVSKTDKDWNKESLKILRQCKTIGLCINYEGKDEEILESLNLVYDLNLDYLQVRPALRLKGERTYIDIPKINDKKLILTSYKFEESWKDRMYNRCEGFHFVPFIWEDGNVDVCAYKKSNKNYNVGNIYDDSLENIINRFPNYVNVENDCQVCCKNHEINMLIHTLKSMEDRNFV